MTNRKTIFLVVPRAEKLKTYLVTFIYHLDEFYELLDLAEKETAHWSQENRIGGESH